MDEANTPVADLKREQSEPSAISQNDLDVSVAGALSQPTPALDEGSNRVLSVLFKAMLITTSPNIATSRTHF